MKIDRLLQSDNVWKISLSTKNDTDVSPLWLIAYQMRFGSAQLKMGRSPIYQIFRNFNIFCRFS